MEGFTVSRLTVLKDNLYCKKCEGWIYCPEMNMKRKNEQGREIEEIGDGCLKKDKEGQFFECPECGSRHYLQE